MSISTDDIIWSATGTVNATTFTATHPDAGGTTAGNTIIICTFSYGTTNWISAGFTRDSGAAASTMRAYTFRKSQVTAGETSWNFTGPASAQPTIWFMFEIQGIHPLAAKDVGTTHQSGTGVTSQTSGTTALTTSFESLAVVIHGGHNVTNNTVPVWSAQTGGFEQYVTNSRVDGSTATSAAVSFRVVDDIATYESTGTSSVTVNAASNVQIYAAAGAHRQANLDVIFGAEIQTTAGHTTGNAGCPPLDFANGTITYHTTNPKTGLASLRLTGTGAAANAGWTSAGALGVYTVPTGLVDRQFYTVRFSVLLETLPASDVVVYSLDTGTESAGDGIRLWYRTATQQFGLVVSCAAEGGAGTEVLSTDTVAADTWYDVDLLVDMANADRATLWRGYWYVDGVEQTMASRASSTASHVSAITQSRMGWQSASTATMRFDDICGSKHPGHFPLGPIRVHPLKVDPAGTVTTTSATSFSTFTNNGTLNSTFNATTARDAVDEIPPTIGASADGFAQDTSGAAVYVEVPMETRAAATNLECLRGVRWYFPGWAASTSAATLGFRAWDDAVETLLLTAADVNFNNSTTLPGWVCRMHRTVASNVAYAWTQAKLDALAARVGFGNAAVAVGVHAILAEVAMREAYVQQVVESEGAFVYSILDPDHGNIIALRLVAPADGDAYADYVINTVPVHRDAAAGTTDDYIVGAETTAEVTFISGGRLAV
jgi:hypothetical protein